MMFINLSNPILPPTLGIDLLENIPIRPSYLPPPAIEPTTAPCKTASKIKPSFNKN